MKEFDGGKAVDAELECCENGIYILLPTFVVLFSTFLKIRLQNLPYPSFQSKGSGSTTNERHQLTAD